MEYRATFDFAAFDFSDGSTVGAPRLPSGGGPGARAWGWAPREAQNEKHLRLPSGGVRPPRLWWYGAAVWRRQRPQKQGPRLPMNDWQAEVPLISQRHRLALTSRTSKQIKIWKWVPVVWYSNISLIFFTVFSEHYRDRSLFPTLVLSQQKRINLKKRKKV